MIVDTEQCTLLCFTQNWYWVKTITLLLCIVDVALLSTRSLRWVWICLVTSVCNESVFQIVAIIIVFIILADFYLLCRKLIIFNNIIICTKRCTVSCTRSFLVEHLSGEKHTNLTFFFKSLKTHIETENTIEKLWLWNLKKAATVIRHNP